MPTEFFDPTTTDGGPVRRRRSITDRQATTARFLVEAADETYDGELDIDWDAPPAPDRPWLPDTMVTLHRTRLWSRLTPEVRDDLARRELVNLLTIAVYAETVLSMLTFREVAEERALVDDRTRWLLKCVDTHARNITMFGRLIDVTGVPPYTRSKVARRLERYTLLLPAAAVTATVSLLLEAAVQGLLRLAAEGSDVQPHVAQIMTIHLLASRRHLDFARDEVEGLVADRSAPRRAAASIAGAATVLVIGRLLINPDAYHDVGLPVARAVRTARRAESHPRRMEAAFGDALRWGAAAGLFDDPVSRSILRRAGAPVPRRRQGREQS